MGSKIGASLGGFLGNAAQNTFGRILGFGEYELESNSLIEGTSQVPYMHQSGNVTRVRHREFIQDLNTGTSVAPGTLALRVSPSNPVVFPWLAAVAAQFQEYRFAGLAFEYVPTSGAAISGTNAALGSISFGTRYNILSPLWVNKTELLNSYYATSASPASAQIHPIECAPLEQPCQVYFVRSPGDAGGGDLRFSDFCTLQIIATGSQSLFVGGELWVTYDVELYKPRISAGVTPFPLVDMQSPAFKQAILDQEEKKDDYVPVLTYRRKPPQLTPAPREECDEGLVDIEDLVIPGRYASGKLIRQ